MINGSFVGSMVYLVYAEQCEVSCRLRLKFPDKNFHCYTPTRRRTTSLTGWYRHLELLDKRGEVWINGEDAMHAKSDATSGQPCAKSHVPKNDLPKLWRQRGDDVMQMGVTGGGTS
ncbi:hypothetical protein VNO77_44016 [Canavalia gladiata]|uniref:Uncharacterized protein n=1 Tax=Canavalia gladiata TaxID=3824 RepID=A0AAN9PPZ3_CANGL